MTGGNYFCSQETLVHLYEYTPNPIPEACISNFLSPRFRNEQAFSITVFSFILGSVDEQMPLFELSHPNRVALAGTREIDQAKSLAESQFRSCALDDWRGSCRTSEYGLEALDWPIRSVCKITRQCEEDHAHTEQLRGSEKL